ncbi:MAG: hypothetical protein ACP5Q3_07580, partial [bacterium]
CYKLGQKQLVECHLAYTGIDGRLHPLGDDYLNPSLNKVTLDALNTGLVFTIKNFKPWSEVKKTSGIYSIPVRFGSADYVGMFFVQPSLMQELQQISIKWLLDNDLIREGKILRGKNSPKYLSKDEKYWIPLPGDYPIYLARMRALIKELNKRLQAARQRIGFLMACSSLVDQAGNLITARGQNAWNHYFLKLPKEKKGLVAYVYFETRLLQWELIQPLKDVISRHIKKASEVANRRINEVAAELARLLNNPRHNQAYNQYFKGREIPKEVRESYMHAYSLLSRSREGEGIYNQHIKGFLHQCNTKEEQKIKKAIESIKETASWVKDFKDEILDIVTAYGTLKLSNELTALRTDLIAASRFLESKGIAHHIDKLEEELNKAIVSPTKRRVNASEYFKLPEESRGWKAFNAGVNALIIANVLMKDHETIKDEIESAKDIIGVMEDLSDIERIKDRIPGASVVKKVAGPITEAMDWGLSIHELYKAADTGKGTEFSLSAVSYCGKGLVLGGSLLSFTPFAPIGLVLVGVGGAIDLLSDVAGFVVSYKSADLKKFEDAFEKIKKMDKNDEIHIHFRVLIRQKVSETEYYKRLIKEPELKKAIDKKWISTFGSDPLRLEDIVEKYFNNHYWGLIEELT